MSEKKLKKCRALYRKHDQLKTLRQPYEAQWKLITKFMSPGKNFWNAINSASMKTSSELYNTTPLSAVRTLANGLQGFMAQKDRFFSLNLESLSIANRKPSGMVRGYLQYLENVYKLIFRRSNFYQFINNMFRTGCTIGTSVTHTQEVIGEDRVVFKIIHPKNAWIAENKYGEIDTVFCTFMMTARQIVQRWEADIPDTFIKLAEKTPYEEFEVLNATYPREDRDITKIDKKNKPFASDWALKFGAGILLEESGYDMLPYIVWRWTTEHGGVYGWCPANDALSDVLSANQMDKTLMEAAHESVHPMMNVPQEKYGLISFKPRGMIPYGDPSRVVSPIQTVGSYPIGRDREEVKERAIKDHFYADLFLMLNNSMDSRKTATEVMEMQSEKMVALTAVTAGIEMVFDQIFDRIFSIATTARWLQSPPPEVGEYFKGDELRIDYDNLITAMSNRYYVMQNMDQDIGRMIKYSEYFPGVLLSIDDEELGDELANNSSIPQKVIRSKQAKEKIKQQQQQAQAQAQGAENMQKQASALKYLGDTNPEMIEQATEAMGG
jgi:hypothetical protein